MNRVITWTTAALVAIGLGGGALVTAEVVGNNDAGLGVIAPVSAEVYQKLHLNLNQQAMWQQIQFAAEDNRQLLRARLSQVREVLDEELGKPEPDLEVVVAQAQPAVDSLIAAMRANRDRRLALYASMSPEQKAVVRDDIKERLARFDRLRRLLVNLLG